MNADTAPIINGLPSGRAGDDADFFADLRSPCACVLIQSVISELSPHLFWDTDPAGVDPQRHAAWLVRRVLEYGRWRDWEVLLNVFGRSRLGEIATGLRSLDPRAAAFVRAYFTPAASC